MGARNVNVIASTADINILAIDMNNFAGQLPLTKNASLGSVIDKSVGAGAAGFLTMDG